MSEIREPLITTTITDLTPQTLASSVGRVYLSKPMMANQEDAVKIRDTWQSVHLPTSGALIPGSCTALAIPGTAGIVTLFVPSPNKSYALYAADFTAAGGTVAGDFGLVATTGEFIKLAAVGSVTLGNTSAFDFRHAVFFDSGVYPAFRVTSGTANHAICGIVYGEVVQ